MRTRREQHQAFRFLTRRIVSAMLSGEPETTELPMRRFAVAVWASLGLAALVFAGVAVYGLLVPGGGKPAENVIIVERETGAKYVYLRGQLHPVLNWTSARLILGQASPEVRTMSQSSLRDVPRGRPVGIPNAPDALPDKAALVGLPWSVCSAARSATSVTIATHVVAGGAPAGGVSLGADEGLLVAAGTGRFLVWRDHRLRVPDNAALAALGYAGIRPAEVGAAFLNALPPGPDLAPLDLPDLGAPAGVTIAGTATTIGQMYRAAGQNYVMVRGGLAPVGEVTARLAEARVTDISPQDVGPVLVTTQVEPRGLPSTVPVTRGDDDRFSMACALYRGSTEAERPVAVETYVRLADELTIDEGSPPPAIGADGVLGADRVSLPGGHGALVSALTAPGATAAGNAYVITDQGIKYPLPRADRDQVQAALGYEGVTPVAVPASILALIPTGAALDPKQASLFQPPPPVGPSVSPSP